MGMQVFSLLLFELDCPTLLPCDEEPWERPTLLFPTNSTSVALVTGFFSKSFKDHACIKLFKVIKTIKIFKNSINFIIKNLKKQDKTKSNSHNRSNVYTSQ